LPVITLRAGHHRTPVMMPGLSLCSVSNMLPRLERVLLIGTRPLRCHPTDGCLGVGEDRGLLRARWSSRRRLHRPCKGAVVRIVQVSDSGCITRGQLLETCLRSSPTMDGCVKMLDVRR